MPAQQRADARRNYARILAVAEEEVAAHGVDASLEQIARTAGVGSATVRRHFPTRRALLEAVSRKRIEALCLRARELADNPDNPDNTANADKAGKAGKASKGDSRSALLEWLSDVVAYSASARGLAPVLAPEGAGPGSEQVNSCSALLEESAGPLLRRAARDGAVATSVTFADLMTLIAGIALATEHLPDPAAEADRLFRLAVAGLSPRS
ncbi:MULTISPECIES: TetR/AcrR family transcriptional regulator [unclassified Streptomyces]|uniref:TetR/AcrR family transcriptional regulator n=1 Tax=unclassified Streptomyces TaxID=2593676 RepID=UPI00081EC780|nr:MULTISPECIES: TetR/AcrR family transcriptional regulator [unclassified Streptomyces]MYZ38387.1 TetR family transcriptional regulator [Streptomyces sp. SID4917]SCF98171.1 transcriptional regulator, TetR family [Streptomyces sp. MnatMP-M17]